MAYIVEMFNGRPSHLIVQALDEDGEFCTKSVIDTDELPDPEWRKFSCADRVWDRTLKLGQDYGWKPMGTSPADPSDPVWANLGSSNTDYRPLDWDTIKQVSAEDAASLAAALSCYMDQIDAGTVTMADTGGRQVLLREGMTEEEYVEGNSGLSVDFLKNYVEFLRKGKFQFCWDD